MVDGNHIRLVHNSLHKTVESKLLSLGLSTGKKFQDKKLREFQDIFQDK